MTKRTYVIAEAGLNHNGSMDIAKQLIDVAIIKIRIINHFQFQSVLNKSNRSIVSSS